MLGGQDVIDSQFVKKKKKNSGILTKTKSRAEEKKVGTLENLPPPSDRNTKAGGASIKQTQNLSSLYFFLQPIIIIK